MRKLHLMLLSGVLTVGFADASSNNLPWDNIPFDDVEFIDNETELWGDYPVDPDALYISETGEHISGTVSDDALNEYHIVGYNPDIIYLYDFNPEQESGVIPEKIGNYIVAGIYSYSCQDKTRLPKTITLPNGMRTIGNFVFENSPIEQIVLNAGLTWIGKGVFKNCEKLTAVKIPNWVPAMCDETFSGCKNLEQVTLGFSTSKICKNAFTGCSSLTTVEVRSMTPPACQEEDADGKSVKIFDDEVFYNAVLYVPAGTKELYEKSPVWSRFANIREKSYYNTMPWSNIDVTDSEFIDNESELWGNYPIDPDGSMLWEDGKPSGYGAFDAYDHEYHFVRQSPAEAYLFNYNEKRDNCEDEFTMTETVYYFSVKGIYSTSCRNKVVNKNITLPTTMHTIGNYSFECTPIENMNFNQDLRWIGIGAFKNCKRLQTAELPDHVPAVCDSLFYGCNNLKEVTLGIVTKICKNAFVQCQALNTLKIKSPTPPECQQKTKSGESVCVFDEEAFENVVLYVPKGTTEVYKSAPVWENFVNIEEWEPEISGISTAESNCLNISVEGKRIFVRNASGKVEVYSLDGQTVYSGNSNSIEVSAAGMYIVKSGAKTLKVIVR